MTENKKAQIGVTGLAVMGANLARNLARNGYTVALHNRSVEKTDALLSEHGADGDFIRTESLQGLVDSLESPRRILIMVKAGAPVDAVIEQLTPLLDEGTLLLTAVTLISPILFAVNDLLQKKVCTLWASAFLAAKKVPSGTFDYAGRFG
ncbi:6-phosphogluconate dehydrogenase, decarboxylating [Rothia dentocariosa]|uniref:6-phosphogluconate dehydrogenase, decarboxylating n=1 Tax=Rothia dentocariosa TaxID=2047 RepID=A0A3S4ZM48_9MICC|nr:6-phosphogluconate dehydrogenase, decarboxylating [Rothia dentocariosa]